VTGARPRRRRARRSRRVAHRGRGHREPRPAHSLAAARAADRRRYGRRRLTMPPRYEVIGIAGIGEIVPGDDIARLVIEAAERQRTPLTSGDVVVLSQKI